MFSYLTKTYHYFSKIASSFSRTGILISLLLFISGNVHCQYKMYYPYGYTIKAKVARIIDGDTFVLSDSQRVRMLGIDTPELERNGKPAEPFSDSAKSLTKQLRSKKNKKPRLLYSHYLTPDVKLQTNRVRFQN